MLSITLSSPPVRENGPNFGFTMHASKTVLNNYFFPSKFSFCFSTQLSIFCFSTQLSKDFLEVGLFVSVIRPSQIFSVTLRGEVWMTQATTQHWMTSWKSKLSLAAEKKLTDLNSFNQITFWRIFHWVFQKLTRLTCQVRPQPMFVCWVRWNNMETAYYDRFHKQAPIPSVQPTKLLLNNYKISCHIKCISLIRVFFFPIIISSRSF